MNIVERLELQAKVGLFGVPDDFPTVGYGEAAAVMRDLLEALKGILAACEDDCGAVGDLTEFDGDDEPVGGGINDDGSPDPMALTFGHLRRAARAIAKAEPSA